MIQKQLSNNNRWCSVLRITSVINNDIIEEEKCWSHSRGRLHRSHCQQTIIWWYQTPRSQRILSFYRQFGDAHYVCEDKSTSQPPKPTESVHIIRGNSKHSSKMLTKYTSQEHVISHQYCFMRFKPVVEHEIIKFGQSKGLSHGICICNRKNATTDRRFFKWAQEVIWDIC